ncbi:MAG: transcriptional regulator [Gemmatimonadaceae bacterium]|nr:transcriptional regulator [Gemmatimonadaceae bacterium]
MTELWLDPVIHAPVRLQICALLSATDEAEFSVVREETRVSDSVLSKHIRQLEEAGYVRVRKATVASRQRTWLALTRPGSRALTTYFRTLKRLAAMVPDADA